MSSSSRLTAGQLALLLLFNDDIEQRSPPRTFFVVGSMLKSPIASSPNEGELLKRLQDQLISKFWRELNYA